MEARGRPGLRCRYLDSIGVPTSEVMNRDFGSPEGWQAWATRSWIERLSKEADEGVVDVLDSQTRPSFVLDAIARVAAGAPATRMVLLDCSPKVRRRRLAERDHHALADGRMDDWAAYLRGEADDLGLLVVDTSDLTIDGVADALEAALEPDSEYRPRKPGVVAD